MERERTGAGDTPPIDRVSLWVDDERMSKSGTVTSILRVSITIIGIVVLAVVAHLAFRSPTVDVPISGAEGHPESSVLRIYSGDCLSEWHIDVQELATQVVVTVAVERHGNSDCPAILESRDITLAEPLGDREVIDGTSGQWVRVRPPSE